MAAWVNPAATLGDVTYGAVLREYTYGATFFPKVI